jgi:hypothetical protein
MSTFSAPKLSDGVRIDRPEAHLPRAFTRRGAPLWPEELPTLACYSPARWPVTSLPSVTALSSVAASIKEKAGRFPAGETHSDGSPVLFYFVSARGVGGGVWLIVHTRIFQASPSRT